MYTRSPVFSSKMYSEDFRWCVVSLKFQHGFSYRRISQFLGISKSTVERILRKFFLTGRVRCERVGRPATTAFHPHEQFVLMESILKNPSLTLLELLWKIYNSTGALYDVSSIHRTLKRFGVTRKQANIIKLLTASCEFFKFIYRFVTLVTHYCTAATGAT